MELFLVRHGIAEEPEVAAANGRSDSERRLTSEGREKASKIARAFRERISKIDVMFHSPYLRAAETAEIFAKEFPKARVESADGLTPHDSAKSALPIVNRIGVDECVMLFGHEPHLSSLASLLLTGKSEPIMEFRKCGIAAIEFDSSIHHGRLQFLLMPKWLTN